MSDTDLDLFPGPRLGQPLLDKIAATVAAAAMAIQTAGADDEGMLRSRRHCREFAGALGHAISLQRTRFVVLAPRLAFPARQRHNRC